MRADETIWPDTSGVSHAFDYSYDMMSQLVSATASNIDGLAWLREDFTYNKDGNVTDYDVTGSDSFSAATDYSYTNSGDSDIMAGATGDGAFALSNDLNGNTTKLPTASANDVVEYNWDNKLRFARRGDSWIWVKYDPMGNRVWRQSSDGQDTATKKYVVDIAGSLPTIIAEYGDPNSLANQYIYADAQILCQYVGHDDPEVDDQTYYYVHDRLGSVRLVVDCNMVEETVTARNVYTYSPFGNPYAGTVTETAYNPFQFTGQWFDAEITQYYLRARQYDPTMMRFMTRDSVRGEQHDPLSLHKYLYCLNDPLNGTDYTGESAIQIAQGLKAMTDVYAAGLGIATVGAAAVASGVDAGWELMQLGAFIQEISPLAFAVGFGRSSNIVQVSRWGGGFQQGGYAVLGRPSFANYLRTFKWLPNQFASPGNVTTGYYLAESLYMPTGAMSYLDILFGFVKVPF